MPERRKRRPVARILIVDDHDLVRAGLRNLLTGERDLDLVGEAATGREAVALCRRLRPDLVLMDVRMPDMDGFAVTRAIHDDFPSARVLLFTVAETAEYVGQSLEVGAVGYVLKGAPRHELLAAIRRAISGVGSEP
jgi:DNA-binding NarL/FixJ family response regulator